MINKDVVVVIPARGGSKGVPRKNILSFCGKPLLVWQVLLAKKAGLVPYVSTEDKEIAGVAKDCGAEVINRPENLASDTTTTAAVVQHALCDPRLGKTKYIVLLQPSSPLVKIENINECIVKLERGAKHVFSIHTTKSVPWVTYDPALPYFAVENMRRQDIKGHQIKNGCVYGYTNTHWPIGRKPLYYMDVGTVEIPEWQCHEIDEPYDVAICEHLFKWMQREEADV